MEEKNAGQGTLKLGVVSKRLRTCQLLRKKLTQRRHYLFIIRGQPVQRDDSLRLCRLQNQNLGKLTRKNSQLRVLPDPRRPQRHNSRPGHLEPEQRDRFKLDRLHNKNLDTTGRTRPALVPVLRVHTQLKRSLQPENPRDAFQGGLGHSFSLQRRRRPALPGRGFEGPHQHLQERRQQQL